MSLLDVGPTLECDVAENQNNFDFLSCFLATFGAYDPGLPTMVEMEAGRLSFSGFC